MAKELGLRVRDHFCILNKEGKVLFVIISCEGDTTEIFDEASFSWIAGPDDQDAFRFVNLGLEKIIHLVEQLKSLLFTRHVAIGPLIIN